MATGPARSGVEKLMHYWAEGEGAAKIRWNSPGDYDRCIQHLSKYVHDDHEVHGLCQNLHQRATGHNAGQAPGDKG